jgi:hypothetical protein
VRIKSAHAQRTHGRGRPRPAGEADVLPDREVVAARARRAAAPAAPMATCLVFQKVTANAIPPLASALTISGLPTSVRHRHGRAEPTRSRVQGEDGTHSVGAGDARARCGSANVSLCLRHARWQRRRRRKQSARLAQREVCRWQPPSSRRAARPHRAAHDRCEA